MEQLDRQTLIDFESIVSYPITNYFVEVRDFFDKHASNISAFYSGKNKVANNKSFEILNKLKQDTELLLDIWRLNQLSLKNYKYWILIENIEKIYSTLLSLENAPRWFRSTRRVNDFTTSLPVDIPLQQGQTLENISSDILGSNNYDNDWVDLALYNDLEEEDYTSEGGIIIKANLNKSVKRIEIKSVVDVMQGDSILGKDITKKITYLDDDLLTVDGKECFLQSIDILLNLRKNQNPEFKNIGLNDKLIAGSNINNITYPTIFRDLTETLRTDDTIKSFTITDIQRQTEAVYITVQIESRLNETQEAVITF